MIGFQSPSCLQYDNIILHCQTINRTKEKVVIIQDVIISNNSCLTHLKLNSTIHGEVYSIQHYVIKLVSDLRQDSGFL